MLLSKPGQRSDGTMAAAPSSGAPAAPARSDIADAVTDALARARALITQQELLARPEPQIRRLNYSDIVRLPSGQAIERVRMTMCSSSPFDEEE